MVNWTLKEHNYLQYITVIQWFLLETTSGDVEIKLGVCDILIFISVSEKPFVLSIVIGQTSTADVYCTNNCTYSDVSKPVSTRIVHPIIRVTSVAFPCFSRSYRLSIVRVTFLAFPYFSRSYRLSITLITSVANLSFNRSYRL